MVPRLVEKFNGKPVAELDWRELIAYNVASIKVQAASGLLSGNIAGGIAQQYGITWEYVEEKK